MHIVMPIAILVSHNYLGFRADFDAPDPPK